MSPQPETICCDYCGLPAGRSRQAAAESVYCCLGCRIAAAVAEEKGQIGQVRWTLTRLGLGVFFAMNVMVFTLALWTQDVYEVADEPHSAQIAASLTELFRYLCLMFSMPVVLLLGGPLLENTWQQLRRGMLTTDALLLLGVMAALAYSLVSTVRGAGHVYFEVVCMVLAAVTLGRWLESAGRLKTTQSLESLHKLLPDEVRCISSNGWQRIPLANVALGMHLRVLPGERFPCDGHITDGKCAVDEQLVTGESRPVYLEPKSPVRGGTLNLDGVVTIEVTALPHEGTLGRLIQSVRDAAASKGQHQRLADRISARFIPSVFVLAIATFATHAALGNAERGLMASLAVALIACPCALALATPMALWAALGRAARRGVLFRDGDALTRLTQIRMICFDKTGTLTTGSTEVARFVTTDLIQSDEVLSVASALATTSLHGLSEAIATYSSTHGDWLKRDIANGQVHPGRGVSAEFSVLLPQRAWLGSPRLMHEQGLVFPHDLQVEIEAAQRSSHPVACVGWEGAVKAIFVFREHPRPEAGATLRWLKNNHIQVAVLSGDFNDGGIATRYGDLVSEVAVGLLPEEKLVRMRQLQKQHGKVAMVGEGLNDAPALAGADVGIALGCGADVSRNSADVCLLTNDLTCLPWIISLATLTTRTIQRNLIWAFTYNSVGIALAAIGWLNPIFAALAMVASSFFVISGSLRLSGVSDKRLLGDQPWLMEVESAKAAAPSASTSSVEPVESAVKS